MQHPSEWTTPTEHREPDPARGVDGNDERSPEAIIQALTAEVEALRASEAEARAVIATAQDAYVSMNSQGVILDWNYRSEQIFGWKRHEVVGQDLAETLIPRRNHPAHSRGLAQFLATHEGMSLNSHMELTAVHRDGREFPVEVRIWPVAVGDTYHFNAFLHDISERRRSAERIQAQSAAAATLIESDSLNDAAPKLLEAVGATLGWDAGGVWVVKKESDDEHLHCVSFWRRPDFLAPAFEAATMGTRFAKGQGLPGQTWQDGIPLWLDDVSHSTNFPRAAVAAQDGIHGAFAFPIISDQRTLGVMEFFSSSAQSPDPDLLRMMDNVGRLLGQFIDRKMAEDQLYQEGAFLSAILNNLSEGIVACDEHGHLTIFNEAVSELHGLPPASNLNPEEWAAHYDLYLADGKTRMTTEQIPLYRALVGEEVRNVEMVVVPKGREPRHIVCSGQGLSDSHGKKLGAVVAMHDITDYKQAEARLKHLAHFDPLTGLANRRQFKETLQDEINRASHHGHQVPVLFLDLDHFKDVNDTLGHMVGDELLRQVGERIKSCLRRGDAVGRLGGDEFALIMSSPSTSQHAANMATRIIQELRQPFLLEGREVTVTASVGITMYPEDATDPDTLIRYADTALYDSKASGRDTYRFYTHDMNTRAHEKLALENSLRKALERQEFTLHYQRKVNIKTGRCTGAEALLRWNDSRGNPVSPDAFIPALEDTGLIAPVGRWVIDEACRQLAEWKRRGVDIPSVAVNVSARQVMRTPLERNGSQHGTPAVIDSTELELAVKEAMDRHGIAAGELELELTEGTLMSNAQTNVVLLQRLKAHGVRVSIDDFGTGYSSLAYLKRFPIDSIKIDRGFVRDIPGDAEDTAIVEAILNVAHSLKINVVAEGVETSEQLQFLKERGCEQAQGYFIGRPAPAQTFE